MGDHNQKSGGQVLARAAAALAHIARGAATGGLAGAAVGTVQAFLPELIKLVAVVICLLLFLPTLVMAALPNILFGYDSATDMDIVSMTDQAYNIDQAYRSVENYSQETIDRIIAEVKDSYTDEDGAAAYDEVEVNEDTDNTNIYWFIAITSAAYHQDLFAMDADSIRNMTISKLSYSGSLVETTTGEGDAAETMRTLVIDIEDLDPDALMRKLDFSEEEETWARCLYATLSEEQYVGPQDGDGEGYYGTNYGDITFSDTDTPVIYYNQTDERWGNKKYGKSGTIGTSGCGPTALAIAVASLADSSVTPLDVAKWSVENGYRCEGNGSYHSLIPNGGAHYGLTVTGIGRDSKKLVKALEDGKLVIAIMTAGHFTRSGHFIVLRGVTSEGKILVADPASVSRSNQEWALGIITNEASRRAGSGGPFWVLSP